MKNIKYLYHATISKEDFIDIKLFGFNTEVTFFCTEPKHTVEFTRLYNGDGVYRVLEVDTSKLDKNKLKKSMDHNPTFFSEDLQAFLYVGKIPADAITDNTYEIEIKVNG